MPETMVSFTQLVDVTVIMYCQIMQKKLETGFLLRNGQMQMQLVKVLGATYQ